MLIASKQRNMWIDVARGFTILLVVLGHILPGDNPVRKCIYTYHMPFFFLISGYCESCHSLKALFMKKISRLYIPYVVWAFLYGELRIYNILPVLYGSYETIGKVSSSVLWFLPTFLVTSIMGGLYYKISSERPSKIMDVSVVIGCLVISSLLRSFHERVQYNDGIIGLPFGFDIAILGLSFYIVGKCLKEYAVSERGIAAVERVRNSKYKIGGVIIGILCISACIYGIFAKTESGRLLMGKNDVGNTYAFFIVGTIVSTGVIMLSYYISKLRISVVLSYVGSNSLMFYLFHIALSKKMIIKNVSNVNIGIYCIEWILEIIVLFITIIAYNKITDLYAQSYKEANIEK